MSEAATPALEPEYVVDQDTGVPDPATPPATAAQNAQPGVTPDWRAGLPQEVQDSPYMQGHAAFEALARDAIAQNRLVGMEKIARPGEESTSEDWDLFYDSMGRPESSEKYDLGEFTVPEGVAWDDGLQKGMLEDFHAAGLSSKQAEIVLEAYARRQGEAHASHSEELQQERKQSQDALRDSWGKAYDQRERVAGATFQMIFGNNAEAMTQVVLPDGQLFGNHPAVIEAMWGVGSKMHEARLIGEKDVAEPSLSPAEALSKAQEMEGNPEIAKLLARGNPNNPEVKRWNRLMDFANPDDAV